METKHQLSDVLKRLVVDIDNMNSFLFSLQNMLESQSENVSIDQTKSDGTTSTISVPSFGYLKGKITDLSTKFDTLLSANNDVIGIKSANGDVRKFELKKTSQLIQDLESIQNSSLDIPTSFKVKNNWFFESFLNPLLYVSLDITNILTDDIDRFVVKRIIINSENNDDAANFFDANYKNLNNVVLASLKTDLDDNAIDYFEDDNIVDMEVAVNRYKGSFDVINILDETGNQTLSTGTSVSINRRRYKLSSLTYTDILSTTSNTKTLTTGDVLITGNDSEYIVRSINTTDSEVVLERIFGTEAITIGANILKFKPQPYRSPEVQVNVGFNERQIIFIKPVSKAKNLTVDDFSNGVALYTNELTIPLSDNSTTDLGTYYNNFVSDFGLILLNLAKEKTVPSILGSTPDAPTLDAANFKVVQIDQHIQDSKNISDLSSNIKEKATLQQEIDELNKKIDATKSSITTVSKTPKETKRLQKVLTDAQTAREEKVASLSTLVTNITLQISTNPEFVSKKKYSVRGFWNIPDPKTTNYGLQNVVQFKYRYRYLSNSGTQPNAQQQKFLDTDGSTKSATFSPWTEVLTKPRTKQLNPNTGLYEWVTDILTDADQVNTNQLDIPIRKGEIVELQVKSLSEAGWPTNPAESIWTDSIQVKFPEEIAAEEEGTILAQKSFAEKAKLDFEESLSSRGLNTHLNSQFTQGDRFYGHKSEDIASGFYTTEGKVIDLYEQLKAMKVSLEAVQQSIATDTGVIQVSVIDAAGNTINVSNGDTVKVFGGYYKDLIKDTTGGSVVYNEGSIITNQYVVSIQNTSANKLELVSLLFGGIGEAAPASSPVLSPTDDYHVNRRYDIVPIAVNSNPVPLRGDFKQTPGSQSSQVKSQYIYSRAKNYGLSEELYAPTDSLATYDSAQYYNSGYSYQGTEVPSGSGAKVPANWAHYLPFAPQYSGIAGTTTNSNVWNGTTDGSSIPQGGGYLTEFCISKNHPDLTTYGASFTYSAANLASKFRPTFDVSSGTTISATATQKYLPFAHALHFETSVSDLSNSYGVPYYKQASRVTVDTSVTDNTLRTDRNYPVKLGFVPNDEYLIGKYTCGAYLYAFPQSYEAISVDGNFPAISSKTITFGNSNAINIPVIFQFRCSDKLGHVGGYRTNSTLTNIKYSKKLGIDIILKDGSPFSFDLQVDAQYTKETTLDAPLVQSTGTLTSF
jgi:hypothetical protein